MALLVLIGGCKKMTTRIHLVHTVMVWGGVCGVYELICCVIYWIIYIIYIIYIIHIISWLVYHVIISLEMSIFITPTEKKNETKQFKDYLLYTNK
jgi:E3 ubiquitin-protein ligase DOA10